MLEGVVIRGIVSRHERRREPSGKRMRSERVSCCVSAADVKLNCLSPPYDFLD